ncbi:copper resistance protein NlpE N-terminal domain-containing protein [Agriterribacter sp.]|uniref:copper resistance protein NlpE N-terminal domain-containing protein n=1 Tax=Agriterribacter sp. TaxID=2821509 RepID=UPI002CE5E3D7|nr:copper resistance protein NlpE N-terminal domain-containing protein [Agriterribacter sp.]HRP54557.1 copper resistance protein NlpE N-terminal domain-containing protein [Agriterribacter sp.]
MKNQLLPFVSAGILFILSGISCSNPTRKISGDSAVAQPADGHNSRVSLDWKGSYHGILPCADCPGIETVISLDENNTYQLTQKYLDRDTAWHLTSGSFTWTDDGNKIILDKANRMLQVGENQLSWTDNDGNRVSGALAAHYRLVKQDNGITEKYWKLVSLNGEPVKPAGVREAYIILKQDGNKLTGHGGCNTLNGGYTLVAPDRIRFANISATKMACEALKTEQELVQALRSADSFLVKGDTLLLYKGRMAPLARFETVYLR